MDFRLFGLRIHLDFTFFAMLGAFLCLGVSQNIWWMLSALLLHECGHLLAALFTGIQMKKFSFSCFGIRLTREKKMAADWKRELLVYLGGPLMNFCCCVLFFVLKQDIPCAIHLLLGCFQLLPIGALDGGCVMKLLLEQFASPGRGEWIEIIISGGMLIPLFWLGSKLFLVDGHNFSLLLCCVFLVLTILGERYKNF